MAEPGETPSTQPEEEKLKQDLTKSLEALRPLTPTPPPDKLPAGVTADQWADMKNLTDLLDVITKPAVVGPKSPTPPPLVK